MDKRWLRCKTRGGRGPRPRSLTVRALAFVQSTRVSPSDAEASGVDANDDDDDAREGKARKK